MSVSPAPAIPSGTTVVSGAGTIHADPVEHRDRDRDQRLGGVRRCAGRHNGVQHPELTSTTQGADHSQRTW